MSLIGESQSSGSVFMLSWTVINYDLSMSLCQTYSSFVRFIKKHSGGELWL